MDESTDTNIKDASGDTIMETTEDTAAAEYDSEGNNLYEEDDAVSASDKTEVANNSPNKNKRHKTSSKKLAPIFEKTKLFRYAK